MVAEKALEGFGHCSFALKAGAARFIEDIWGLFCTRVHSIWSLEVMKSLREGVQRGVGNLRLQGALATPPPWTGLP